MTRSRTTAPACLPGQTRIQSKFDLVGNGGLQCVRLFPQPHAELFPFAYDPTLKTELEIVSKLGELTPEVCGLSRTASAVNFYGELHARSPTALRSAIAPLRRGPTSRPKPGPRRTRGHAPSFPGGAEPSALETSSSHSSSARLADPGGTFEPPASVPRDSSCLLGSALGIAGSRARFVSGYLIQLKAARSLDGPSRHRQ